MDKTNKCELFNKYEESIKSLKNIVEYWAYKPSEVIAAKTAILALEKQVPKKINETPAFQSYYSVGDESEILCPSCEYELDIENQIKYCSECGQRLSWKGLDCY